MNLIDVIDPSLKGRSGKTALKLLSATSSAASTSARDYSFGDLESLSNQLANFLASRGISKGDRVSVYAPNSPWITIIFLAALKLGAIYVPVNFLYRRKEVADLLADAEPKLLVVDSSVAEVAREAIALRNLKPLFLLHPDGLQEAVRGASSSRPQRVASGEDPAGVFYTSGTTGRSKGAVLTHNNLAFNAAILHTVWQWTESDSLLLSLPLSHLHGLANGMLGALVAGASLLLLEKFAAERVLEVIEAERATLFFGVPTMYARFVAPETNLRSRDLSSARLFVSGSAPLPPTIHKQFQQLTGHDILERYGLSEALMVTSNPYQGERRAGTVGFPLPGIRVRIALSTDEEAEPEEEGELWIRGPNVFNGYWRDQKATAEVVSEGWLKSGDLAKRSRDGYITICGRTKELIISGGFNIYPREVEELLTSAPGVREAAVIGVPDPVKGEVVKAFVVAKPGHRLDWEEIRAHCRDCLASFKVPKEWQEVRSIPRNAMGKVIRHALSAYVNSDR